MLVRCCLPSPCPPSSCNSTADPLEPVVLGRYLAQGIPGAHCVEHQADYHMTWQGDEAWFLDETEGFLTGHRPVSISAERFLATVLFTDIVRSTEVATARGDQAWRRLLDRHNELAAKEITRFGGRVIKTTGDGLALFDSPSQAVASAVALHEALEPLGLQIRVGVRTGEAEWRRDDVSGLAVHIGARIAALAGAREVPFSDARAA